MCSREWPDRRGSTSRSQRSSIRRRLEGDAHRAFQEFSQAGGEVGAWSEGCLSGADVVVDAIFGIGLSRALERATGRQIEAINACGAPVFALDIPSGLHADTGRTLGPAIIAERTLTFIGLKIGLYLGVGPDHAGVVAFDALDTPTEVRASIEGVATRIDDVELHALLPRRRRTTHKGAQGRLLIIGGGRGMAGAARLAGEAALRVGAGLVTVATHPENVAAIVSARPELICRGIEHAGELKALIERADVLAVGPGLGQDEWARTLFGQAAASGSPAVVDADALNLLAERPRQATNWVLTPHPGEAARLLGRTTAQIQEDRLGAARALVERFGGIVVLKGAGTLVATADALPGVCDRGNPGMASAGMGDVLTGVIAGIAAQTGRLADAARVGVLVHATAGDLAAQRGERGLIATDLFEHLQTCVNPS